MAQDNKQGKLSWAIPIVAKFISCVLLN